MSHYISHPYYCLYIIILIRQGFTRLESGTGGRGVWFHKDFVQGKPENIKLIKRVPVKNPKVGGRKREIPQSRQRDYTNYQLPLTVQDSSSHQGDEAKANSKVPAVYNPPPPRHEVASMPSQKPSHVPSLPPNLHGSIPGYLSSSLNYGIPAPVPMGGGLNRPTVSDHARQYPPFVLTNFQPYAVPSMNMNPTSLQTFISGGSTMSNPNAPPPSNGNLGLNHMAQQLLAARYEQPPPPPSASYNSLLRGENSSTDINTTLLAMLLESRSREAPQFSSARSSNQLDHQLLSALTQRDLQRRALAASREQAPPTTTTTSGQGLFTEEQLMAELARRNLDP